MPTGRPNKDTKTPLGRLMSAIEDGQVETVRDILNSTKGIDLEATDKGRSSNTALVLAVDSENPVMVQLLVDAGAQVTTVCGIKDLQHTAFNRALRLPTMDVARMLIQRCPEIVNIQVDGWTPLFHQDNPETIAFLLEHGADPTIRCGKNQATPREDAFGVGIDVGVADCFPEGEYDSELVVALKMANLARVEELWARQPFPLNEALNVPKGLSSFYMGPRVNALGLACAGRDSTKALALLRKLVEWGARPNHDLRQCRTTPLIVACDWMGREDFDASPIARFLLEHGAAANINFQNPLKGGKEEPPAIWHAASRPELLRLLIEHGGSVHADVWDSYKKEMTTTAKMIQERARGPVIGSGLQNPVTRPDWKGSRAVIEEKYPDLAAGRELETIRARNKVPPAASSPDPTGAAAPATETVPAARTKKPVATSNRRAATTGTAAANAGGGGGAGSGSGAAGSHDAPTRGRKRGRAAVEAEEEEAPSAAAAVEAPDQEADGGGSEPAAKRQRRGKTEKAPVTQPETETPRGRERRRK